MILLKGKVNERIKVDRGSLNFSFNEKNSFRGTVFLGTICHVRDGILSSKTIYKSSLDLKLDLSLYTDRLTFCFFYKMFHSNNVLGG